MTTLTASTPSDAKRTRDSSPDETDQPIPGESPLTSRAVRQRIFSGTAASVVSPTASTPPSRPFEESWKQCSDALHKSLGAVPYGDVPPMTDKPPMSVVQLLEWGDKYTRGEESEKAPPQEQVFMRWTSHTLTCLAEVNKTRAGLKLRTLSDAIKQSPPDSRWLPPHLLLRHGPDALLQQLHMLPPAVVASNLSDFDGWLRSAASLKQLSHKISGWEKLLGLPSDSAPDQDGVPSQPMAEPPPALNGSGSACCHSRGLMPNKLTVIQKSGAATQGGTESHHWQVLVSVRNVARAPRTVSRLVVAEEPPRPPTAASIAPKQPKETEAGQEDDGDDDERAAERTQLLRWLCSRQFDFKPPVELKAGGFFGGGGEIECLFKVPKADDNPRAPCFAVLEIDADSVPSEPPLHWCDSCVIACEWSE